MKKKFLLGLSMLFFAVMFFAGSGYANTSVTGTMDVSVSTMNQVSTTNGGVYIVNGGTLTVNNGVSFTNNIASGTAVYGGAIYIASGTVNLNAGTSGINFSNNLDSYTGSASTESRKNDIYMYTGNLNVSGSGDTTLGSGLAGSGTVNKTSSANLTIADASDFRGTINISSGNSNITNKGVGTINYSVGTVNTFSGTTASGTTLANAGDLTYNGGSGGKNEGDITGIGTRRGNLTFAGTVTNTGAINQRTITNNGTLTSTLGNLTVDSGFITNQLILRVTDISTLNKDIIGKGSLIIDNEAAINATSTAYKIAQGSLQIESRGTLTAYAGNLHLSALLNNGTLILTGGTLEENMTGVSTSNTSFTGNVTLSGINSGNLGTMTLNGGDLTIKDGYNLSMGSVVFSVANTLNVTGSNAVINNNFQSAGSNIKISNSGNLLLTGNITSASGNFVKDGVGNMMFDEGMSNNYANTVIDSGTLSGYCHNIMGDISGDGSVEFLDMYSSTTPVHFTKDIDLGGDFIKSGDAAFNVTSDVFNSDNIILNAGAFFANSDYITVTNNVDVNNGAVLGGNGTISAAEVNINAGGTLNAGNSIDTLNIENAVLNFKDDSKYYVEIEQSDMYTGAGSRSDNVTVTNGSIEIHNGSQIEVYNTEINGNNQGRYFVHERFEILTSSPSDLLGEFAQTTVSGFDAFRIETDLEYDFAEGKTFLNVMRIRTDYEHDVYGLTHNQKSTARGIDSVSTGFGGDLVDVLMTLEAYHYYATDPLNPDHRSLAKAMDEMSGSVYANALMAPYFHAKKSKVHDRIYLKSVDHKHEKENAVCYDCSHNLWIEYTGSYNKVDKDSNTDKYTNTSNGVLVGYDRSSVESNMIFGGYAGYSKNNLEQGDDTIDADVFTVGAYGGFLGNKWDFQGVLSASLFDNDAERKIDFMSAKAESSFDQKNIALDLKGAYKLDISKKMQLSPFAGILTSFTGQDEIKEDGAGSLNLKVDSENSFIMEARMGVELKNQYEKFAWYVSAAVSQMLTDSNASIDSKLKDYPASFKDIRGAERGKTLFDYNLGAEYKLTKKWVIFADFQGDLSDNTVGYYGDLGIMFKW